MFGIPQIERLKELGVQRFVIGISDFSMEQVCTGTSISMPQYICILSSNLFPISLLPLLLQLLDVVDSEDDLFLGSNYQYLQEIIARVRDRNPLLVYSIPACLHNLSYMGVLTSYVHA